MSGDTFEAEERALLEQLGREPSDTRHAEELQRAFEALDSAGIHMLRGGSDEVGDGICRLAGERDQYKSQLLSIARGIGMMPDGQQGFLRVVQCALHLAAKAGEQVRTVAAQDARLRALENLVAEKNARIAALEREHGSCRRAIDDAVERLSGA